MNVVSVFAATLSIQNEAAQLGFDWDGPEGPLDKLREEIDELAHAIANGNQHDIEMEIGDMLFSVVNVSRHVHVEPESALTNATQRFDRRFARVRATLASRGKDICDCSIEQMDEIWEEAKRAE